MSIRPCSLYKPTNAGIAAALVESHSPSLLCNTSHIVLYSPSQKTEINPRSVAPQTSRRQDPVLPSCK